MPTPEIARHLAENSIYLILGLGMLGYCLLGFRRAGYRLRYGVLAVVGTLITLNSILGLVGASRIGWLEIVALVLVLASLAAIFVGYAALAIFLVINGLILLRREGRALKNLLTLLIGLWMMLLPFGPFTAFVRPHPFGAILALLLIGVWLFLLSLTAYAGFCFLSFLISAVAYRRLAKRFHPSYIIILGAGLNGESVTPLLATRLNRALEVYRREKNTGRSPILIPSGGQGPDEILPEGRAMRNYLVEQGADPADIRPEIESRTTMENLRFSQRLMDSPKEPVYVATSDYHVYRAAMFMHRVGLRGRGLGARTAKYYVPSAFLREFVAVMAGNRWIHLLVMGPVTLAIAGLTLLLLMQAPK